MAECNLSCIEENAFRRGICCYLDIANVFDSLSFALAIYLFSSLHHESRDDAFHKEKKGLRK